MMRIIALIIILCCAITEIRTTSGGTESARHRTLNKVPFKARTTSTTTEAPEPPETVLVQPPKKIPERIVNPPKKKLAAEPIPIQTLQEWAEDISNVFTTVEKNVVRAHVILDKFKDIKRETRDGMAIVENVAKSLEDLLEKRAEAARNIGREAEKLAAAAGKVTPSTKYTFDNSIGLNQLKEFPTTETPGGWEMINNCSDLRQVPTKNMSHFGKNAMVQLDISSVKVASEVFDCDYRVLPHVYWSEGLLHTFRKNYAQDAMLDFQYFCSAKGFLRHYPAASWDSMFKLQIGGEDGPADVYDCRLRPWYVAAGGAPRDILILFDFSGSMVNSSNKVHAEQLTLALLTALTDDDQVNILYFYDDVVESVIKCFDDTMVPANHVNSAALMTMLKAHKYINETHIPFALTKAVELLNKQKIRTDRPKPCQQAIVIISDSINENYTDIMLEINPNGEIRLFVIWLHDVFGLRDNSAEYSQWLACANDGYNSELTDFYVTDEVMKMLRVLERPLVHQRKERLTVFSDVYAHVEDPRRGEYYWRTKENEEQAFRYAELRRNKKEFLKPSRRAHDYDRFMSLNTHGYYYERTDLDYRLQISVSVPVFDDTRSENITIILPEEKQRNSTRTYPARRLLGVAGIDIPIEHLKLILPYYQLGAGGSLFIIDHRGNVILHDNLKPVFDGDILRPGYRTVDMLELEQGAAPHQPRNYSKEWMEFRNDVVINQMQGKRELEAKYIFENELRAILGKREYYWKRVKNHYTVVVSLPKYNKRHAVPDGTFTQQLAERALSALAEMAVHPEWLYCKHVNPQFDEADCEVRHFIMRRRDEPNFKMQNLHHVFSPHLPTLLEKTYICNEELMARLCKEAIATEQWANEHQDEDAGRTCPGCELGSVTAFFASESGLTRWQQYHMASKYDPPPGSEWPLGPAENWYKRAAAAPGTLVIHAPVTPIRKMRRSFEKPPGFTIRDEWYTAARTLGFPDKGMIGVGGFHFHPQHLEDVVDLITNRPCPEDTDCEPRCDNENWACVLIDEGGWIVAGDRRDKKELSTEDPIREHLARVHPHAMRALLDAGVFQLNWIHDYQAICFPPEIETIKMASTLPSILRSLWVSVRTLLHVTRKIITVIALISTGGLVAGQTDGEKKKRQKRIWKDWQREQYEQLYSKNVIINRTRFATCDRSRAFYVYQRNKSTLENLKKPFNECNWPVQGVEVPKTNLLLLAIFLLPCPKYSGRPVPDPLTNVPVDMKEGDWERMTTAAHLACWRNKIPLPIRAPHTTCFPHNYADEAGYRQCGPWMPDPEEPDHAATAASNFVLLLLVVCLHFV